MAAIYLSLVVAVAIAAVAVEETSGLGMHTGQIALAGLCGTALIAHGLLGALAAPHNYPPPPAGWHRGFTARAARAER